MDYCLGGTSIVTKKYLSTSVEKIEEDINISSENLDEVSRYLSDILQDKMCGMVMGSVL